MKSIIEALEAEIPKGYWCHHQKWCPYHEQKKPSLAEDGTIQINFCHLLERFINKKECEINKEDNL